MALVAVGYNLATHFGSKLAHKRHTLIIIPLALNTLQNIPRAGGVNLAGAYHVVHVAWEMGPMIKSACDVISDVATYRHLAKLFTPESLLFRTGVTTATLMAEALACKSAADTYSECSKRQRETVEKCEDIKINDSNIRINEKNNNVNNCMKISEENTRNDCILRFIDEYNENGAKNNGDPNLLLKKCLAAAPSCVVPWLARDTTCAVFGGWSAFSAWAIGREILGKMDGK